MSKFRLKQLTLFLLYAFAFHQLFGQPAAGGEVTVFEQRHQVDVYAGYGVVRSQVWLYNPLPDSQRFRAGAFQRFSSTYWPRLSLNAGPWQLPPADTGVWMLQPGITHVEIFYGTAASSATHTFRLAMPLFPAARKDGFVWLRLHDGLTPASIRMINTNKAFAASQTVFVPLPAHGHLPDSLILECYVETMPPRALHRISWERHYALLRSWQPDSMLLASLTPLTFADVRSPSVQAVWWAALAFAALIAAVVWWRFRRLAQRRGCCR